MYIFDHCVNYVNLLFESNYNFIGTLRCKFFVFLSEEKESYLHEKKKEQTNKQTNKQNKNSKTKEGLYFWVNAWLSLVWVI